MRKKIIIDLNQKKKSKLVFNKKGDYLVFFKNVSGELEFIIDAEKVNLEIYGLFIGNDKNSFRLKTFQHHLRPNSQSNLLIKGVFYDQSRFFYNGLIRIEKNAQHSHAYQKNQNLILSDKVFVQSEPKLEILANNVFCTHGSTTGFIDENSINYLRIRGLSLKKAQKLLVDGFINEIVGKMKV